MENKQSAVNWLIDNILCDIELYINEDGDFIEEPKIAYYNAFKSHVDLTKFVEKAKEMHKEEIKDAYLEGGNWDELPQPRFDNYYNSNYGN